MTNQYPVEVIANYFLDKGSLSHIKLQKLLYFANGWQLAFHNISLIDEPIQAWEFGPVISTVFYEFRKYGRGLIHTKMTVESENQTLDKLTLFLLDNVWESYGQIDSTVLANWTHIPIPENPWINARARAHGKRFVEIHDEEIKVYFKTLLDKKRLY